VGLSVISASCWVGGAPVGGRLLDAGGDLVLQRGDADLEELVEVRRRDGAELGPLEQRDPALAGELQDAVVERQPAQLAVDEPIIHGDPSIGATPSRRGTARLARRRATRRRAAEVPLDRDGFALGVARHALAVAAELRVVRGSSTRRASTRARNSSRTVRSPQSP
jgi:hypothetical protein